METVDVKGQSSTEKGVRLTKIQNTTQHSVSNDSPSSKSPSYVDDLVEVLREFDFPQFASFEKCLPKLLYDPRFTSIPKENRKSVFLTARRRLADKGAVEKALEQTKAMQAFKEDVQRLISQGHITSTSTVKELLNKFSESMVWKKVESQATERDEFLQKRLEQVKVDTEKQQRKCVEHFTLKVQEAVKKLHQTSKSPSLTQVKNLLRPDPDYYSLESCTERHQIILNVLHQMDQRKSFKRGPEVENLTHKKRTTGVHETCRHRLEKDTAKQLLYSLLTERIKNPFELPNYSTARQLYLITDPRLKQVDEIIQTEDQEKVFRSFLSCLEKERLDLFENELKKSTAFETPDIHFDQADQLLQWTTDRRFKGIPKEQLESRFQKWKNNFLDECKASFEKLLRTCALMNSQIPEGGPEYLELLKTLEKDPRYTRLDGFQELRETLIRQRLEELKNEGSRLFV